MVSNSNRYGFLADVRVLDLADEKADFCTKLLADMGARVIKVEKPGGDQSRKRGPFYNPGSSANASLPFYYNNTNKHGITLDIEHREGKSIFLKLLKKTDVLVETSPPGYLKGIGLDYKILSGVNSQLILVSVSGFGQHGLRRNYKTCDLVASAYGGQMYVSGSPSATPLKAFGDQSYYSASLFATTGILLALRNRAKTGKGDHVDIALQTSVAATLEHVMSRYFSEKIIHRRQESRHWNGEFVVLPCKDGFIHVTPFQKWETLIEWLEVEGMAEDLKDDRWLDEDYRRNNFWHVIEVLKKWTAAHTTDEIYKLAQMMRFPWAPVQSPTDVLNCPQLNSRNFFVKWNCPESGTAFKYPGLPYKISDQLDRQPKPAPLPGEHNGLIYRQELGISEKTLKRLYRQKVI
jgi:crotonobetainyl-CoA:carnitine CoA-transferase CaiB-like acyl-CoA transferase